MIQKNKFETFEKPDDFDKMLFNYYDNKDKEIPLSTQNIIENAFKKHSQKNLTTAVILKRVAIFIICISIVTVTTVYAKDIINFITNIFTNSTPSIDKAVDNGYVQNIDMDFITYNDVGVKVDYLLMDEHNLDISFVYKYYGETASFNILTFNKLTLKDERNKILCLLPGNDTNLTNNVLETSVTTSREPIFIDTSTVRESVLVSSEKFNFTNVIHVEITQMTLLINNDIKYIDGNWNFSINIDEKIVTQDFFEYSSTYNPYVEDIKAVLSPTSLSIELQLNTLFDEAILYKQNSITLEDENNNKYRPTQMLSKNISIIEPYSSTITLLYPISSYDNINKLFLHINLALNKHIDLELSK